MPHTKMSSTSDTVRSLFKLNDFHSEKRKGVTKEDITVMIIDPGTKNCGIRCVTKTKSCKNILHFDLLHFGKRGEQLNECLINTISEFKVLEKTLLKCDYILIEKQLTRNTDLIRQMQNIETIIMTLTRDKGSMPILVEIDSKAKSISFKKCSEDYDTKGLNKGAKNRMTKKKGIDAAQEILLEAEDTESIRTIEIMKKKDDLSDVCCYEYVWWWCFDLLDLPIKFCE